MYFFEPRQLWVKELSLGRDPESGKRRRQKIYGKSKSEVEKKVADLRAKSGGTITAKPKGTVGELVEGWLEHDIKQNRSENTFSLYSTLWNAYAKDLIAGRKVSDFDAQAVEALYAALRKKGVGGRTIESIGARLSTAFEKAVRRRQILANPFRLVTRPGHRAKESPTVDMESAGRFLAACRGDRFEALYVVMLEGGLRLGEALALRWTSIDWKARTIAIEEQLVEVDGKVELAPTKTRGSRRLIELGPAAIKALRRRERAAAGEPHKSLFAFTTPDGAHPRRSNLRQRSFQKILKAAGIDHLTLHGLRHSMGVLMASAGVPTTILKERFGHETTRMTLDRYGHRMPGLGRQAADELDAALQRSIAASKRRRRRASHEGESEARQPS